MITSALEVRRSYLSLTCCCFLRLNFSVANIINDFYKKDNRLAQIIGKIYNSEVTEYPNAEIRARQGKRAFSRGAYLAVSNPKKSGA